MKDNCFIRFKQDISDIKLPTKFTYPFSYTPHPIAEIASKELQDYLSEPHDWFHEFGIEKHIEGTNIGKMFGVLIVRNTENELGYLAAFSGKLANKQILDMFVPPVAHTIAENSFYVAGEKELGEITNAISKIEKSKEYKDLRNQLQNAMQESEKEMQAFKSFMSEAKEERHKRRIDTSTTLTFEEYEVLLQELQTESMQLQYKYKTLKSTWQNTIQSITDSIEVFENKIFELKSERKKKSQDLQSYLFEQFQFLNAQGDSKDLKEIFANTVLCVPPAGAGECSAPKLLQYSYLQNYTPIAMAEFWWGQSPQSEIRKHKNFYPSCKGKCLPILSHMLVGLDVEENPIAQLLDNNIEPKILFEDDYILVVDKPANMLSVPGNIEAESVLTYLQKKYNSQTIYLAHRLDMATSGLLVAAKSHEVYVYLQEQFVLRIIQKRYVALLDGILKEDEGVVKLPMRLDYNNRPQQMVCFEKGKPAVTRWRVIQRTEKYTKVYLYPHTGRTHQLRVHSAHQLGINIPIVGDDLYGKQADRLYLHAEQLSFLHPHTHKIVRFQSLPNF